MTYENFKKYMEFVKYRREFLRGLENLMGDYFGSWISLEGEYESKYLDLLKDVFDDKEDWISYWVYELDFGKEAKKDTITDNGKNIPIKTIKDLYNLINEKSN